MISIESSVKSFYVIFALVIIYLANSLTEIVEDKAQINTKNNFKSHEPTPIEMYQLIEVNAEKYDIPKHIAYNIAYLETRYKGPFHWSYNPNLESFAGAVGPMQVMVSTAEYINNKRISKNNLKNNLDVNIETSMKLLRRLYGMYGDWALVCGFYNTGKPIINDYARFCVTNKDYRKNWVYYQNEKGK